MRGGTQAWGGGTPILAPSQQGGRLSPPALEEDPLSGQEGTLSVRVALGQLDEGKGGHAGSGPLIPSVGETGLGGWREGGPA